MKNCVQMQILDFTFDWLRLLQITYISTSWMFTETNARNLYATPADCGMTECDDFISGWTLGIQGQCFDDQYGVRIGNNGYRVVVMEVNPLNCKIKPYSN